MSECIYYINTSSSQKAIYGIMGTSLVINFGILVWWLRLYLHERKHRDEEDVPLTPEDLDSRSKEEDDAPLVEKRRQDFDMSDYADILDEARNPKEVDSPRARRLKTGATQKTRSLEEDQDEPIYDKSLQKSKVKAARKEDDNQDERRIRQRFAPLDEDRDEPAYSKSQKTNKVKAAPDREEYQYTPYRRTEREI